MRYQMDEAYLARLAEKHGWTLFDLMGLFGYEYDDLAPADKSPLGIIGRALEDGDDFEWIEEMVSQAA